MQTLSCMSALSNIVQNPTEKNSKLLKKSGQRLYAYFSGNDILPF